jgi:hypothetical protein
MQVTFAKNGVRVARLNDGMRAKKNDEFIYSICSGVILYNNDRLHQSFGYRTPGVIPETVYCAAGQGRVIKRVKVPPRKEGHPPGSESLEADW